MTRVNFLPNNGCMYTLSTSQRDAVKDRAKKFEAKLTSLGCDAFVKQHIKAREEEIGIYSAAQYCIADFNTKNDRNFGTPEKRFEYLLRKARKYQTDEALDAFATEKKMLHEKHIANLKATITDLSKKLETAKLDLSLAQEDKDSIVRGQTYDWVNSKVDMLYKLFDRSQGISDDHKRVKEQLASGELP